MSICHQEEGSLVPPWLVAFGFWGGRNCICCTCTREERRHRVESSKDFNLVLVILAKNYFQALDTPEKTNCWWKGGGMAG